MRPGSTNQFLVILALAVIAVIAVAVLGPIPKGQPPAPAPPPAMKASKELQDKREKLIDDFIRRGLIHKIENHNLWVTPAFMALDFDDKKVIAELVFAWSFELPQGQPDIDQSLILLLKHSKTGNAIGSFSTLGGLSLD